MGNHPAIQAGPLAHLRVFLKGLAASRVVIRSVALQRLIRSVVSPAVVVFTEAEVVSVASMEAAVSPAEAVLVVATVVAVAAVGN